MLSGHGVATGSSIPRSEERGPIEAERPVPLGPFRAQKSAAPLMPPRLDALSHPRSEERGPIEARPCRCRPKAGVSIPRSEERGPIEVSGDVKLAAIGNLTCANVDLISVSELTHCVRAADLSMRIELFGN